MERDKWCHKQIRKVQNRKSSCFSLSSLRCKLTRRWLCPWCALVRHSVRIRTPGHMESLGQVPARGKDLVEAPEFKQVPRAQVPGSRGFPERLCQVVSSRLSVAAGLMRCDKHAPTRAILSASSTRKECAKTARLRTYAIVQQDGSLRMPFVAADRRTGTGSSLVSSS